MPHQRRVLPQRRVFRIVRRLRSLNLLLPEVDEKDVGTLYTLGQWDLRWTIAASRSRQIPKPPNQTAHPLPSLPTQSAARKSPHSGQIDERREDHVDAVITRRDKLAVHFSPLIAFAAVLEWLRA